MTRHINSIETFNRYAIAALLVAGMETPDLENTMQNLGLTVQTPADINTQGKDKMKPETKIAKARQANEKTLLTCISGHQASVSFYFAIRSRRDEQGQQTHFYEQKLRCHRDDTFVVCAPVQPAPAQPAPVAP